MLKNQMKIEMTFAFREFIVWWELSEKDEMDEERYYGTEGEFNSARQAQRSWS